MNLITFEEYLEYQMRVAACISSNLPDYIADKSKAIVDKILELNNTKVSQHEPATSFFKPIKLEE
jgi:hypothetical protein